VPKSHKTEITVRFVPDGKEVRVPAGSTVMEAAARAEITVQSSCGGRGACGKCKVKLLSAVTEPGKSDVRHFTADELSQGYRLACLTRLAEDAVVEIPAYSRLVREKISLDGLGKKVEVEPVAWKLFLQLPEPSLEDQRADLTRVLEALGEQVSQPTDLSTLQALPDILRQANFQVTAVCSDGELIAVEPGDTSTQLYGMAFDIGTTTIVGYLMHLESGAQVAVDALVNPQAQFGDDVISRISHASTEGGLKLLQQKVVEAINHITLETCRESGVNPAHIYEMAVVGNTCMMHLLLGINPASLATAPYVPVITEARVVAARELGLEMNPHGRIYVLPNIAGFVGADTVGVIIASGLEASRGLRAAVDIGTNGEVIVAKNGRLLACSTAAGPAFEGARISQGMRAASGAIDRVSIGGSSAKEAGGALDSLLQIHTIDETPARGICGSGVVDAIAALREIGLITASGRLLDAKSAPETAAPYLARLEGTGGQTRFILVGADRSATGQPICITSQDVRELQNAKAAICAGVMVLLDEMGAVPEEIEEFLLAGAFGNYIRRENALAIGMIPALPLERVVPIGNAAGLGARLALASAGMRRLAEKVAERVEYVELSNRPDFYSRYTDAMELAPVVTS